MAIRSGFANPAPRKGSKIRTGYVTYEDWFREMSPGTTRPDRVKQIYFRSCDGYWLKINDASE